MIKTGNVPLKFTSNPVLGAMRVNLLPPDDYLRYHIYIKAVIQAMVDEFGAEEVASWRFGVFTEFENPDWFCVINDQDSTKDAFLKIYDCTVSAIEHVLGSGKT